MRHESCGVTTDSGGQGPGPGLGPGPGARPGEAPSPHRTGVVVRGDAHWALAVVVRGGPGIGASPAEERPSPPSPQSLRSLRSLQSPQGKRAPAENARADVRVGCWTKKRQFSDFPSSMVIPSCSPQLVLLALIPSPFSPLPSPSPLSLLLSRHACWRVSRDAPREAPRNWPSPLQKRQGFELLATSATSKINVKSPSPLFTPRWRFSAASPLALLPWLFSLPLPLPLPDAWPCLTLCPSLALRAWCLALLLVPLGRSEVMALLPEIDTPDIGTSLDKPPFPRKVSLLVKSVVPLPNHPAQDSSSLISHLSSLTSHLSSAICHA